MPFTGGATWSQAAAAAPGTGKWDGRRARMCVWRPSVCDLTVCASRGATSSLRFAGPPPLRSVCECGFPAHACSLRRYHLAGGRPASRTASCDQRPSRGTEEIYINNIGSCALSKSRGITAIHIQSRNDNTHPPSTPPFRSLSQVPSPVKSVRQSSK